MKFKCKIHGIIDDDKNPRQIYNSDNFDERFRKDFKLRHVNRCIKCGQEVFKID